MAEEVMNTQGERNQTQGRRRIRLKPRSKVWDDFTRGTGDNGKETATCKRCGKVYAYHGTKNLHEHLMECGSQESADAGATEESPQEELPRVAQDEEAMQQLALAPPCDPSPRHGGSSSGLLQEEASKHLARMIALRGYDPSLLEDVCFRRFVASINPEFRVPSRMDMEEMCDGVFDERWKDLFDRMKRAPGKVSVAVGTANIMEEQVVYVACHFIDDGWSLHKLLLPVLVLPTSHHKDDGPIVRLNLCYDINKQVRELISRHGIGNRLFMVAYEKTNSALEDEKTSSAPKDNCSYSFVPEVFSITNPNMKEILFTTYMDHVLHSIARCLLPNKGITGDVSDMWSFKLTRQGRLKLLAELDLQHGVLSKIGFPRKRTNQDSDIISTLCSLWKKFYHAIQDVSSSTRPTANLCLAELFKLREEVTRCLLDRADYVQCALKEAHDTLDKAIKDSYLEWSLPLALDPRYKLNFITSNFKTMHGPDAAKEYVDSKVKTKITELYDKYVEEYGTADGAHHSDTVSAMDTTTSADNSLEKPSNESSRSQQGMATQVSSSYHPEAETTELNRYLNDPLHDPQAEDFDILNWWKAHSLEYPMVARMARDALAMPTCSKLSSDQMALARSILRRYSKNQKALSTRK